MPSTRSPSAVNSTADCFKMVAPGELHGSLSSGLGALQDNRAGGVCSRLWPGRVVGHGRVAGHAGGPARIAPPVDAKRERDDIQWKRR